MAEHTPAQGPGRVAEGHRNRQRLLEAAAAAFAEESPATLKSIAGRAGVGIGTLYRHFPTREALVEAVYESQVQRLGDRATFLLDRYPPHEALRRWGHEFVDWARTKHGMNETLRSLIVAGQLEQESMRGRLVALVERFLVAGVEAGDLRADARAEDVAALLVGVMNVATPTRHAQALRLSDLVVDGLRPYAMPNPVHK